MSEPPNVTLTEILHDRGAAVLYSGVRGADGARVIVKALPAHHLGGPEEARLRNEHRILQGIASPSVPRAVALQGLDGGLALVLESAPGRPLDGILRERRLALVDALTIGSGVARALVAVHRAGVIHRDVKPANITVDLVSGAVQLIDFGLAVRRDAVGRSEALEGSLAYIAPEQTGRMDRSVDARSDLYALGVTLYELLTGALPFTVTDPVELVHAHLARPPGDPRTIAPSLPPVVAALVLRLLHKAPEDRYQSAAGLLFDLEAFTLGLHDVGHVPDLTLGARDVPVALSPPEALFAREEERALLRDALDRAAEGEAEVVVLTGPPGIGKSALLRDLAAEVPRRGGRVGGGKCEQTGRAAPFAPLTQALGAIFVDIGRDGPAACARLREDMADALGPNRGVLVDLVPEAGVLLDTTPGASELKPEEAKNRLVLVIERALAAVAEQARPLTLLLDDVQWLDPASVGLLRELLLSRRARGLLLVVAMRDGEGAGGSAAEIRELLDALWQAGVPLQEAQVAPLDVHGITALTADTLRLPGSRVGEVAAGIFARTGGNPLSAMTLLRSLHEAGALSIDAESGVLEADFSLATAAADAADVAVLLVQQLGRLAPWTQRALTFAACLGHSFDGESLATVLALPDEEALTALDEALRGSFVLTSPGGRGFRFAHDRVQQAALSLVSEPERHVIERDAGRRLRAKAGVTPGDETLFSAVALLNGAGALITDPDERLTLARDNLHAGQRALGRAAFAAAQRFYEAGAGLLDEFLWKRDHDLAFALLSGRSECEAARGDAASARACLDALDGRACTPEERLRVAAVRVDLSMREGRNTEAVAVGCEALRVAGIDLPPTEEARRDALTAAVAEEVLALERSPPEARLAARSMTDPTALSTERLLLALGMPAYFISSSLFGLLGSQWVRLLRQHGHSRLSAMGYANFGAFLTTMAGGAEAHAFGRLALDLVDQQQNQTIACKVTETVCGNILFLFEPLRDVLGHFPTAMRAGLDAGDLLHVNHICGHITPMRVALGDPLREVVAQTEELIPLVDRYGDVFSMACLRVAQRTARALLDEPREPPGQEPPGDEPDAWSEAAIDEIFRREDFANLAGFYRTQRLVVRVFDEAWSEAFAEAEAAEAKGPYAPGQFFATELAFFASLARLEVAPPGPDTPQDQLAAHRADLRAWARSCPETYAARHLLIEAEVARTRGEELTAMRLYDEALSAARSGEMLRDEAITAERCAAFHAGHGRSRIARAYLADALTAYRRVGAGGKVRRLEERLSRRVSAEVTGGEAAVTATAGASALLDATAAIRAAQAITTEVVLARVVERLLRIVAEVAGAERALLLVERNGRWSVEAHLGPDDVRGERGTTGDDEAPHPAAGSRGRNGHQNTLGKATGFPVTIVRQVARSGGPILLADAARADAFVLDPFIERFKPRSVLCMEVAHAARRAGILYLENNAARGAFAPDRIEPLRAITAQAAIAMENARLYEQLEATTADLRESNAWLEEAVARRTAELRRELAAREAAEEARARLTEEIISAQQERIAELSAPILPIAEGVVLIPLIGSMDESRAAVVLGAALDGASAWSARVVLLDVTGMKGTGGSVASSLVRTARALALLGAEAVITGMRPEVARELVETGAELLGVTTRSSLRSGIAYALRNAAGGRRR
ncbi:AAA family ATPase [Chondromyces crocatus]|uniref:Uncharacterized protein n=1 Tax=Chondromyces crocatus TaxID=52 RepID=A0A0K1E7N4_CHOCO|nr:AAA family ATPase [Chondromyces crocatus]AKT36874.1 uncharacterized protein CMC5_009950 [Chondromyces crocatus]